VPLPWRRRSQNIYEMQTKVNLDPAFIFQAIYFYTQNLTLLTKSQAFIVALVNVIFEGLIFCFIFILFILFANLHFHALINLLIITNKKDLLTSLKVLKVKIMQPAMTKPNEKLMHSATTNAYDSISFFLTRRTIHQAPYSLIPNPKHI